MNKKVTDNKTKKTTVKKTTAKKVETKKTTAKKVETKKPVAKKETKPKVKTKYTSADSFFLTHFVYMKDGEIIEEPIKSNEAFITGSHNSLPIRKKPDFKIRPHWFKTDLGYISAYRVYAKIEFSKSFGKGTKTISYNFKVD